MAQGVESPGKARGMAMFWLALASCLAWGLPAAWSSQENPPASDQTLRVTTSVVNVYAVVRDKKRPVPDLTRDDFELTEDGAPQDIRYFSRETDTPLTMGILVDTSPSQQRVLGVEQEEAKTFINQVVRPKDLTFILHFDLEVELLQDFTSDHRLLARAIDSTQINGGGQGVMPGPFPGTSVGGTHLHDAVYLASRDLLKGEVGRKVLIMLTDGEDQGSRIKLDDALEAAQKSDVIIYTIAITDRSFYWGHMMGFQGDSILKKYSEETGGRVIEVSRAKDTAQAFQDIADELRTQYLLGYTPKNTRHDGSFRKIRVKVRGHDYKVQARRGYYAPAD
ncbi:MAG: VWA domain-containing protein [Acidobacteriia bacterium]|nr:VWA domain-containing protein [Terriglobia bacterium]